MRAFPVMRAETMATLMSKRSYQSRDYPTAKPDRAIHHQGLVDAEVPSQGTRDKKKNRTLIFSTEILMGVLFFPIFSYMEQR